MPLALALFCCTCLGTAPAVQHFGVSGHRHVSFLGAFIEYVTHVHVTHVKLARLAMVVDGTKQ